MFRRAVVTSTLAAALLLTGFGTAVADTQTIKDKKNDLVFYDAERDIERVAKPAQIGGTKTDAKSLKVTHGKSSVAVVFRFHRLGSSWTYVAAAMRLNGSAGIKRMKIGYNGIGAFVVDAKGNYKCAAKLKRKTGNNG